MQKRDCIYNRVSTHMCFMDTAVVVDGHTFQYYEPRINKLEMFAGLCGRVFEQVGRRWREIPGQDW